MYVLAIVFCKILKLLCMNNIQCLKEFEVWVALLYECFTAMYEAIRTDKDMYVINE